ncbi:MAG: Rab family GTPase [Promethearchaeota archaeon]
MSKIDLSKDLTRKLEEIKSHLETQRHKSVSLSETLEWLLNQPDIEAAMESLTKSMEKRLFYKSVIIGDAAVGKTELVRNLDISQLRTWRPIEQTIGVNVGSINTSVKIDGRSENLAIQIFDLVGDYSFASVQKIFYLGSCGALVVYDITRKETFESVPFWVNQYLTNSLRITPIVIVANKIDLRYQAQVDKQEGLELVEKLTEEIGIEISIVETSAIKGENVSEAFSMLTHRMVDFFIEKLSK